MCLFKSCKLLEIIFAKEINMFLMDVRVNYSKVMKVALFIIITVGFVSFFYNNIFLNFFYVANEKCDDMINTKYKEVVSDYYIRNFVGKKLSIISNENLVFYETEIESEIKKSNSYLDGSEIKVTLNEILQNKNSLFNWEIFKGKLMMNSIDQCIIRKEQVELENGEMQDNLVFYGKVSYKISSGIFSRDYETNVFFQIN
jgi:hypothetical protein